MAEQIASGVLCAGTAEMEAEAPVGALHLRRRPALHGHARDEEEAAAVRQLAAPARDLGGERREWEVGGCELARRSSGRRGGALGRDELVDLRGLEPDAPVVARRQRRAPPCGRRRERRLPQHALVRPIEVVPGLLGVGEVAAHSGGLIWSARRPRGRRPCGRARRTGSARHAACRSGRRCRPDRARRWRRRRARAPRGPR